MKPETRERRKVGVLAHMPEPDGRSDLYEAEDDHWYHWPCNSCRNNAPSKRQHCRQCVHYVR